MTEFKPCPFCGHDAIVFGFGEITNVVCSNEKDCGCGMTCTVRTPEEAARIWNRRTVDVDALKEIADEIEEPWPPDVEYSGKVPIEDVREFEHETAERIRKAVGCERFL